MCAADRALRASAFEATADKAPNRAAGPAVDEMCYPLPKSRRHEAVETPRVHDTPRQARAAAWPLAARAQQRERRRRIAVFSARDADDPEWQARLAAFHQGLQELGWIVTFGSNSASVSATANFCASARLNWSRGRRMPSWSMETLRVAAAGDAPCARRVRECQRSCRCRIRREPGAAGWQRYRIYPVRIWHEREMAGSAQADLAGLDVRAAAGRGRPRMDRGHTAPSGREPALVHLAEPPVPDGQPGRVRAGVDETVFRRRSDVPRRRASHGQRHGARSLRARHPARRARRGRRLRRVSGVRAGALHLSRRLPLVRRPRRHGTPQQHGHDLVHEHSERPGGTDWYGGPRVLPQLERRADPPARHRAVRSRPREHVERFVAGRGLHGVPTVRWRCSARGSPAWPRPRTRSATSWTSS